MLKSLTLKNVGPASEMTLNLGSRLNILTGDNGLGKSFLLDVIWWTLTRTWPQEINSLLTSGGKALPHPHTKAEISAKFSTKTKGNDFEFHSQFDAKRQKWRLPKGRPTMPGLVLYAMVDGSFAVWDPARHYWKKDEDSPFPANIFSPKEIWNGLSRDNVTYSNGLIQDWASWQNANDVSIKNLKVLLKQMSPPNELIEPGKLTRIDLQDVRDMPTLKMSYNQEVPVVHVSSGMKRIIALTYMLLWAWQEHRNASKLTGSPPSNQVVFLVDEIESHLHPSWQRSVLPSLLRLMHILHKRTNKHLTNVQLITSTHSPLIMSSIEPFFTVPKKSMEEQADEEQVIDAWFDLDFNKDTKEVTIERYTDTFEKKGDANSWLESKAFDLSNTYPIEYQELMNQAKALFNPLNENQDCAKKVESIHQQLQKALHPEDDFFIRWLYLCRKKGWLK